LHVFLFVTHGIILIVDLFLLLLASLLDSFLLVFGLIPFLSRNLWSLSLGLFDLLEGLTHQQRDVIVGKKLGDLLLVDVKVAFQILSSVESQLYLVDTTKTPDRIALD
jgi:hypothetical protein